MMKTLQSPVEPRGYGSMDASQPILIYETPSQNAHHHDSIKRTKLWHKGMWAFLVGCICIAPCLIFWHGEPMGSAKNGFRKNVKKLQHALEHNKIEKTADTLRLESSSIWNEMYAMVNTTVDPCTDFYEYACGKWLRSTKIPEDRPNIDTSFTVVEQRNERILQDIFQAQPPVITEYYNSCVEQIGNTVPDIVRSLITAIDAQDDIKSIMVIASKLFIHQGVASFFGVAVQADPKNPSMNIFTLSQGGLSLPSREYYLSSQQKAIRSMAMYRMYFDSLFALADLKPCTEEISAQVFKFEMLLAQYSYAGADLRDPWGTYHKLSASKLESKFPYLAAYLSELKPLNQTTPLVLTTPTFFENLSTLLRQYEEQKESLHTLKYYLKFKTLDSLSNFMGEDFRRINFEFHGKLSGLSALIDRHKYCQATTLKFLGGLVGKLYLQKVFDDATSIDAKSMIQDIESSFRDILDKEFWLDVQTKSNANKKLNMIDNLVGGPVSIETIPFEMDNNNFFLNSVKLIDWGQVQLISKVGTQANRRRWDMQAFTVNAYYDPSANKMVFPAAIMQPPFFNGWKSLKVFDYARIGMVMGHELSHGFDDQGRNFDGAGKLVRWWTSNVSALFDSRSKCIVDQYSKFPILTPSHEQLGFVDGRMTLGENIADNAGLKVAYHAYKKAFPKDNLQAHLIDLNTTVSSELLNWAHQLTEDRLFYIAYAQLWCEVRREEYSELLMSVDPHSPGRWRVNGPLQNFDHFADSFSCRKDAFMNPKQKCHLW